ncbi:MAG: hypothetical protein PF549_04440 [Patescibacteria group bacterium]|jgi:hypothetical protein|nr:hypothetical protein [Patescibacteria group bacterium]
MKNYIKIDDLERIEITENTARRIEEQLRMLQPSMKKGHYHFDNKIEIIYEKVKRFEEQPSKKIELRDLLERINNKSQELYGEQLFTWSVAMREVKKTDEEAKRLGEEFCKKIELKNILKFKRTMLEAGIDTTNILYCPEVPLVGINKSYVIEIIAGIKVAKVIGCGEK